MMLTVKQVAEKLGLTEQMVRRLAGDGKLPGVNTASEGSTRTSWKFDDKALREWRAANRNSDNGNGDYAKTDNRVPDGFVDAADAGRFAGVSGQALHSRLQVEGHGIETIKIGGRRYFKLSTIKPRGNAGSPPKAAAVVAAQAATPTNAGPSRMLTLLEEIAQRTARVEAEIEALKKMWT